MGAWGLGLFENDHDFSIVDELDERYMARLNDAYSAVSQMAIDERGRFTSNEFRQACLDRVEEARVSFYANQCDIGVLMRHLVEGDHALLRDLTGGISLMNFIIDRYTAKLIEGYVDLRDPYRPGYRLVIAGACFMTLGCTMPESFTQWLKQNYTEVGLMRDGVTQMKKALDGEYKNEAYDFGSRPQDMLRYEEGAAPMSDRAWPNSRMINTAAPNDTASPESIAMLPQRIQDALANEALSHRTLANECRKICTGCNATDKKLSKCGKCMIANYCGKECQVADHRVHKPFCKLFSKTTPTSKIFVGNRTGPGQEWTLL